MNTSRLRSGALVACALFSIFAIVSTAAADDRTSPTMTIAFSPASPTPGAVVTMTVTVTPGTNPDSTGLDVSCDLGWANAGTVTLDPDASGLVFTTQFTVPSATIPGERVGSCTVTDAETRFSTKGYSVTIAAPEADAAPAVTGHTPADGDTGVPVDANIGISFSEPVNVADGWYSITCDTSGTHTAAVTLGEGGYLLNPDADFAHGEQCTVSLDTTLVTDQDTNDPPDDLTGTTSWTFTTEATPTNLPPTVKTTGPYSVDEGGTVSVSANGNDPENGTLTYAWDLDGNGTFETPGQTVAFSSDDGAAVADIAVRVTDLGGLTATSATTVTVDNVPPTASLGAPATSDAGFAFALNLSGQQDPSAADTTAGFTYAFDCGAGYGAYGTAAAASCATSDVGTLSVGARIRDKDGGVTEYRGSVDVRVTYDSLCALVRAYASDPKVADDLCAKLAQAAAASGDTGRAGVLGAFRNQVDAKVGKGLTADQGAELKLLSTRL